MNQRLTIALPQVKAGSTSALSRYILRIKENKLLKKVYNYIINSINS